MELDLIGILKGPCRGGCKYFFIYRLKASKNNMNCYFYGGLENVQYVVPEET